MPIYDYICGACGERIEVVHGVHASGPERCERCGGGPMRKAMVAPTVHFKGSGWAKKERASSGMKPARDPGIPSSGKSETDGSGSGTKAAPPAGSGGNDGSGGDGGSGSSGGTGAASGSSGESGGSPKPSSSGSAEA